MSPIGLEESQRQIDALFDAATAAMREHRWGAAADIYLQLLAHPCAHHRIVDHEVLDDLFQAQRAAGKHDEAIASKRAAIAAGLRSSPDPEADIAETLIAAGRRDEADALYAELRQRDPDDVWLYNSAGFAYAGIDDRVALRWCLDGIEVALATGDPDQLVDQLLDLARREWSAVGEQADGELIARVEAFIESWVQPPYRPRWDRAAPEAVRRRCEHCGFDPARPPGAVRRTPTSAALPAASTGRSRPQEIALAWFPAGEWILARARWDELADMPVDHVAYSHRIEARLKWITKHMPEHSLHVAALSVDELDRVAGERAGTGEVRAEQAAQVLRLGGARSWPPGRNDRCWCGSGRKYKQCCGRVPPATDEPDEPDPPL